MDNRPLVLVADDEPQITKLVAMTLTEEGFRVITARDGEDAIDKVAAMRPDVVILDVVMPGMSGIEVMNHLRDCLAPAYRATAISGFPFGEPQVVMRT